MGLLDKIFKRHDPRYNHVLNDEERELGLKIRKQNQEFKAKEQELKLKILEAEHNLKITKIQADIAEAEERLSDFVDEEQPDTAPNADSMLMMMFMQMMNGKAPLTPAAAVPVQQSPQPVQQQELNLTDEQINEFYNNTPRVYRKMAKKMSDEQLVAVLRARLPAISQDSLNRALAVIHNS